MDGDSFYYVFEDTMVTDGFEYTYSVVAYDMGVEPPFETKYEPLGNGQFGAVVETNYSNPDQWASPMAMPILKIQKVRPFLTETLSKYIQVFNLKIV